ncbi:MAG: TolC family protein [Calditrichales bacterium]|nr:TolC family protein [Calditrichales bacterium]
MKQKAQVFLKRLTFLIMSILLITITKSSFAQDPLTLEHSLGIALQNSPQIKHSKLNLERSQQFLNARKASLKSQFSLTLTPYSYSHTREFREWIPDWDTKEQKQSSSTFTISQPIKWTDGTLALINQTSWRDYYSEHEDLRIKTYSNNLYLSFRQPIFTYNRTKLELRELELDLENATLNYAIQKLYLEYQVTQNFFNAYQKKASLEIAKDEYHNREQSYLIIKNKVEAGLDPREELYQAELDLTSSKSKVQNEQTELENYIDRFKQLIGLSIFDDVTVTTDISHHPVEIDLQTALDTGLKYRMELRQRKINIENANYDLIRASATNEFKGDINLSYGIIGTTDDEFENIYDTPTKDQRFSLELNVPLWDWGQKKSRIKAYRASIKDNELTLEDERSDIIIEIRRAYRNLKNLVNQIEIANQNVRNAQLTYDINLERYKNGDLTSMDLNLIQNQLSNAKMNKISALINYKLELLNIKILSLYDFERNEQVVTD